MNPPSFRRSDPETRLNLMETTNMKITILGGAGMMGQGIIRDLLSDRAIV